MEVASVGWGISMAGWIISPYITRLLDKVYSRTKSDHKSRDRLHKLKTHVIPRLKLVLEAADGSEHKLFFERLVSDLKSAFRDTEDILDEVDYIGHHNEAELRRKQRKRKSPESGPSNQECWSLKQLSKELIISVVGKKNRRLVATRTSQIPGPLNDKLDKNIKKIERLIDEARTTLSIENEVQGSNLPSGSGCAKHGQDATAKYIEKRGPTPTGTVTGRDDDCERIMKMLEQDGNQSSRDKCLSVIGIHGIPGSGKTTLAQYIFQKEKTAGYFDLVMWIHVSENFRVDTIFMEMIEQAWTKNEKCPKYNSLVVLENILKEELTGKRFLLVLDDIWCSEKVDEQKKLQQLIPPLTDANTKTGSKILVTSRHKDALSELGHEVGIIENSGIPELDDDVFLELLMHNAFGHRNRDVPRYRMLLEIGTEIAKKLRKSPLLASVVGGMLYKNLDVDNWRRLAEQKSLEKYMGPLWWCYQHLDEEAKRCFAYCSIFPRRGHLYRDELVNLWVAEGFVSTTNEGSEMELVGRRYFDELLSVSFLLPGGKDTEGKDCFVIHDLLHDLAKMVAGSDCFKIDNAMEKAPSDVSHLSIESCSVSMINEDIIKLKNLRTLIIFGGENDISEEVLERMFKELTKLRVFIISSSIFSHDDFFFPKSIDYVKHLRYLGVNYGGRRADYIWLPGTIEKLYLLQVLDISFALGNCYFTEDVDVAGLTNLRHLGVDAPFLDEYFPNIGRLTSLQTMPPFSLQRGEGYELHQLGDLNNLQGKLEIRGLEVVNSKEEALQAKLADKRRVTSLVLSWNDPFSNVSRPEVEADVFEGLCPPEGLEFMSIYCFNGSRYPEWMFGREKSKMELQRLNLSRCSKLVPAPVPGLFFIGVTCLKLFNCDWDAMPYNMVHVTELELLASDRDALPGNIDQLTSLRRLIIKGCSHFRRIPALPTSLWYIKIEYCHHEFTTSCKDEDHPNYKAIEHIPQKHIVERRWRG